MLAPGGRDLQHLLVRKLMDHPRLLAAGGDLRIQLHHHLIQIRRVKLPQLHPDQTAWVTERGVFRARRIAHIGARRIAAMLIGKFAFQHDELFAPGVAVARKPGFRRVAHQAGGHRHLITHPIEHHPPHAGLGRIPPGPLGRCHQGPFTEIGSNMHAFGCSVYILADPGNDTFAEPTSMKELETKYLLVRGRRPQKALRRLLQDLAWAGFQIQPKTTRLVHDVYFDTAAERLRRAGWSLRCRHKSLALVLTCKQLGQSDDGFFERREIEQTTLHESPQLDSLEEGPVRSLLQRYVPGSAELKPLFALNNERSTYHISHPDHPRALIEMVFDRVRIDDAKPLRYVEFEGELKQGPVAILETFSGVLAAHPDLVQSRTSKFHRGLFNTRGVVDVGDRTRDLMSPADAWSKLGASYLAEQMHALAAYEPYAYEGLHPEGVHQMRVATRRLRAALKAFGGVLPKTEARSLAAEAGWLCDVLGAVRDLDVQLEHLHGYRRALPKGRRHSLDAYEQHLERNRLRARRCLNTALDSNRFRRFQASYLALQSQARAIDPAASPTIAEFAHGYVPKRLAGVRREGRKIHPGSEAEVYHRLRIRIKKLRYGLEILNGPYGTELARASKSLRRLQAHLGDHQDACVAEEALTHYRDTQSESGREARTFDRLITAERDRAEKLRRRFPDDWERFEKESRKLKRLF